jgi:hypothetical protein
MLTPLHNNFTHDYLLDHATSPFLDIMSFKFIDQNNESELVI